MSSRTNSWIIACTLLGMSAVGCGSSSSGPSAHLGDACTTSAECVEGECANAGVCTKECAKHSDCGCAAETTNGDIASGSCDLSCMEGVCAKVCQAEIDCAGETSCIDGTVFDACL